MTEAPNIRDLPKTGITNGEHVGRENMSMLWILVHTRNVNPFFSISPVETGQTDIKVWEVQNFPAPKSGRHHRPSITSAENY